MRRRSPFSKIRLFWPSLMVLPAEKSIKSAKNTLLGTPSIQNYSEYAAFSILGRNDPFSSRPNTACSPASAIVEHRPVVVGQRLLGTYLQFYNFHVGLQLVQVICPLLHHLSALRKVSRSVVRSPGRVAHGMSQLMFDEVRTKAQHFIKNRPGHRPEAMPAHFILADI